MGNIASKKGQNKREQNAAVARHQWNDYSASHTFSYTNNAQLTIARISGTTHGEKRYDLRDPTLRFVDGEDEMDCKSQVNPVVRLSLNGQMMNSLVFHS